jgi:ABC-type nitrate/sulfonate/bicarbonate transport system substrate-binding protein
MTMMTLLMVGALAFAVFSLAQAMVAMARGPDQSGGVVRALTRRIGISVLLFVLLMVGWKLGFIQPHGVG